VTRLERHLTKSPGEKSLGPTIGGAPRNLNPFTARDADLDLVVLEDIETINFGRGVPDPTPGGAAETPSAPRLRSSLYANDENFAVAAMSGPDRRRSFSEEKDPSDMSNPDGHFPRESGPMWKDTNFTALNLAPRTRRGASPASVNTYLHAEWTEPYWDAVRDDTGIWNSPPPPEMEVERAIYDAMKRETIDVGGYNVPFPRHPKESDYHQETDSTGATFTHLRATRSFPFRDRENSRWTDGHPLYHATPTGSLPKILAEGLVASAERQLWFGASPTVWNEQFPHNAPLRLKSPVKGMSFLRISPTDAMNERLSLLARVSDVDRATLPGHLAIDSAGNPIGPRDSRTQRAVGLYGDALFFDDVKIPGENIEVLNQNGEWIPLYKTDLSDVVFDPSDGADAGMGNEGGPKGKRIFSRLFRARDRGDSQPPQEVVPTPKSWKSNYSNSYGGDEFVKGEQRLERIKQQGLAASGEWRKIHNDHYDWWAFPIDRGSASFGETFNVAGDPLERLKKDPEFLSSLAKIMEVQAAALGWSLYEGKYFDRLDWDKGQDWNMAYPTRLWKMTRSAQIFGLEREFESLLDLQESLEAGGIVFGNHRSYWDNPGTVDDVPSLGKSWTEREDERKKTQTASGAASWTSPYRSQPEYPKQGSDDSQMTLLEEDRAWDAYDNYEPPVFPVVSDAEELADILSEPDEVIEFGYPYERIDKETRQLIADDIFFAVSLLMDGEFPDEEFTDRLESAEQMRRYADEQEGLYPDDGDILYALADALENPVSLYEDAVYESTDGEAGMGRKPSPEVRALVERVAEMHNGGKSATQIAEELGITRYRVHNYRTIARRRGLLTSPRQRTAAEMNELIGEATRLYNEGKTRPEMAREMNLPVSTINNLLQRANERKLLRNYNPRGSGNFKRTLRTPGNIAAAADKYRQGKTTAQIAEELALTESSVIKLIGEARRLGLDAGPRRYRTSPELEELMLEVAIKYEEGKLMREIAQELDADETTVQNLANRAAQLGLIRRDRVERAGDASDELTKQIMAKLREGKSQRQIARELNVPYHRVNNLIKRARRVLAPDPRKARLRNSSESLGDSGAPDGEAGMSSRKIPKFNGGHSSRGRGTPSGDGKDQAMRDVADSAIVELANDERSSSRTTLETLGSYRAGSMVVMLARNGELRGLPLRDETIQAITNAHEDGATFVVGDMPGVDSQFVDYLEKIGADYTIYHAGSSPRFSPQPPDALGDAPPELLARATDDEAQLNVLYSVPGVAASVRMRSTDGAPVAPGKNAIMKPYLLAPHIDVNDLDASDPAIQSLSPALKAAGLGSYEVTGHSSPKVQGPVVKEFADRLIGPSAVANAVLGTFPTADEMLTIYAVNALIRARAEYLSDSVLDADQVNEAILFGRVLQLPRNLWEKSRLDRSVYLDPFSYFGGKSNFLKAVIDALPERVRSGLAFSPAAERIPGVTYQDRSWGDTSHFESIIIREDDDLSRRFAPMVRNQAKIVVDHARRHDELTKKWAQTAYDLMKEAGLTDAEVAFVINEHWTKASRFKLATVQPGSVLGHAARLGVKAFSSRYSPINRAVTKRIESVQSGGLREEEDFGLHEFFHHYLGQGFTRHGEYVAFRGPADLIDSYHGHMQWAWNDTGQLGMFVSRVMTQEFGRDEQPGESVAVSSRVLFDTIGRAIYDRLKEMLSSAEDRRKIMDQVFPEFHGLPSEDEAKIKELIRRQFAVRDLSTRQFADNMPILRLLTAQDLLVPKAYWPYGGETRIIGGSKQ